MENSDYFIVGCSCRDSYSYDRNRDSFAKQKNFQEIFGTICSAVTST